MNTGTTSETIRVFGENLGVGDPQSQGRPNLRDPDPLSAALVSNSSPSSFCGDWPQEIASLRLDFCRHTPVISEPGLAAAWGLASLAVKRDDLTSSRYGGTKVRALEFLIGEALAAGARGVVTLGPTGSHHVVSTAIFADHCGLRTRAVLFPQPPHPDLVRHAAALDRLRVERWERPLWRALPAWWRACRKPLAGHRPFVIPPGGTSPLGILGATRGALEFARDVKEGSQRVPDVVIVPVGSCGTVAGLALGFALAGFESEIVGVRVVPRVLARRSKVLSLMRRAAALLRVVGLDDRMGRHLRLVSNEIGPGYARASKNGTRALDTLTRRGSFRGESTYTAKALAHVASGRYRGRHVLFWNTFSAIDPTAEIVSE